MYTLRLTSYPMAGKADELRALLTDRVKQRQSQGIRAGLTVRVAGEGGAFAVGLQFPDLAGVDKLRQANRTDPGLQAYQAKLAPLIRAPGKSELLEVLLPAPAGPAPAYVQRVTLYPSAGNAALVRALLEERQKASAAAGVRTGLARSVVNAEGQMFAVNVLLEDLAALERVTQRNASDPSFQAFLGKIGGLIQRGGSELFEVVVPLQP